MGCYVNPDVFSKEAWLFANGRQIISGIPNSMAEFQDTDGTDNYLVCLVDNGLFSAAAICYSDREIRVFRSPDGRPKRWFVVAKALLREVSDLEEYEKHGLTE